MSYGNIKLTSKTTLMTRNYQCKVQLVFYNETRNLELYRSLKTWWECLCQLCKKCFWQWQTMTMNNRSLRKSDRRRCWWLQSQNNRNFLYHGKVTHIVDKRYVHHSSKYTILHQSRLMYSAKMFQKVGICLPCLQTVCEIEFLEFDSTAIRNFTRFRLACLWSYLAGWT